MNSFLTWLHPSQILYCDTDSAFVSYDKTNLEHIYPHNDDPNIPDNVRLGNHLGAWEDELKGGWIMEFVAAGPKSYAYITNKGKLDIKMKSITLDRANNNVFTFNNIRDMVLNRIPKDKPKDENGKDIECFTIDEKIKKVSLISQARHQFKTTREKNIETKYISRSVQSTTEHKRQILSDNETRPYGFKDAAP